MAKVNSAQTGLAELKQHLKSGEFAPLYFFYGEERYLQEYYLSALRKKLVDGPMEEFNYRRFTTENFSLSALKDAVEALPMMAEYTLVQVDDFDPFAQNEETRKYLTEFFADLPDTCCLVFYYDTVKYSRNGTMKKLLAAITEHGVEVEFQKQSQQELAEWISRHFRALEKTITPDLCQHLIFLTGGDMTTLHSEILKIASYSRMSAISKLDIDMVVEPVLSATVFDVTDALSEKNFDRAMGKLRDLFQNREEPIAVLAAVGSHFRRLYLAKTITSAGKGLDVLMEALSTNKDYYPRKLMNQASRFSQNFLSAALRACFEADSAMKSNQSKDSERVLELLLLTLAQEANR